jgi:hypothetical protein
MNILNIHTAHLQNYEHFQRSLDQTSLHLSEMRPVSANDVHHEIENLASLVTQLPAYKMRRCQMAMHAPYHVTQILSDYSLIEFSLHKGETCLITDNSNQIKWKVFSLDKQKSFYVPSVCFLLTAGGPDAELLQEVESLKEKYEHICQSFSSQDVIIT